jgi:hypothetical protein
LRGQFPDRVADSVEVTVTGRGITSMISAQNLVRGQMLAFQRKVFYG